MAARRARVTAAYATVRVVDAATGGATVLGFYQNALLPESAVREDVERLVRREYAEWVGSAEVPAEEPPLADEDKPEPKKTPAKKAAST